MAYRLNGIKIRTNNTPEGMKKIEEIWSDVASGKLPVLFDSEHNFQQGISPVSKYSNYESDQSGNYDFSILGVAADFFHHLEQLADKGLYKKYDISDDSGDIVVCTQKAWEQVWNEQKSGQIQRAFTSDYESAVPAEYTKDGKAHCYLYIAVVS